MTKALKSPYPYFGGKSRVAAEVWKRFGGVKNYVEPFFGSGAVLLARPDFDPADPPLETINDKDGMVSNFWRAIQADPDLVAKYADWPVIENDLHARHAWLVGQRESLTTRLEGDPDYCDPKVAGYWVWGMACWIGSGFCSGEGSWVSYNGELVKRDSIQDAGAGIDRKSPRLSGTQGVNKAIVGQLPYLIQKAQGSNTANPVGVVGQLPHIAADGRGVISRKMPHFAATGRGVTRKRVHLSNSGIDPNTTNDSFAGDSRKRISLINGGRGVAGQRPHLSHDIGMGVLGESSNNLTAWFHALSTRLRRVRVASGDWTRVMGQSVTWGHGLTGIFLDPPYSDSANRESDLYTQDSLSIAHEVREWCLTNGDNPLLRIALCGYEGEHNVLELHGWTRLEWKAAGGYGTQGNNQARLNAHREVIWFSPHCLQDDKPTQLRMFE